MMLVTGYICMNIFYGSEYLSYSSTLQLSIYLVYGILFTILLRYFYNIRVLGIYFVLSMILFGKLRVETGKCILWTLESFSQRGLINAAGDQTNPS